MVRILLMDPARDLVCHPVSASVKARADQRSRRRAGTKSDAGIRWFRGFFSCHIKIAAKMGRVGASEGRDGADGSCVRCGRGGGDFCRCARFFGDLELRAGRGASAGRSFARAASAGCGAGRGHAPVPPVASPAPAAADTGQTRSSRRGRKRARLRSSPTAMPGADARRSEAATSRRPAKSSDLSPTPIGRDRARPNHHARARCRARTPSIDAKASTAPSAEPRRPRHRRRLRRRPRRSRLRRCAKPRWHRLRQTRHVGPPVQSRHANAASPKADTVVADVPQVIRMPPAPTPIAPSRGPAHRSPVRARPCQHAGVEADGGRTSKPKHAPPAQPLADPAPIAAEPKPAPVVAVIPPAGTPMAMRRRASSVPRRRGAKGHARLLKPSAAFHLRRPHPGGRLRLRPSRDTPAWRRRS